MSTIQDIKVGRGILTLNTDSEQEFSFDYKGCECCNDKARADTRGGCVHF